MKTQVTNISIWQNAKFLSILVLPFSLFYVIIGLFLLFSYPAGDVGSIIGIIFIMAPLWFSLMYFAIVAMSAIIYNYIASKIGGIEFELTEIKD